LTQAEIYDILKQNPNCWYSTTKLREILGLEKGNYVARQVRQMVKFGVVDYKINENFKRKTCKYVIKYTKR
jgi:DNA-binding MarR family transcriptional regulator